MLWTIPAAIGVAVIGYLLGSVDFAIIVTKVRTGKDIRDYGSGNAGMTNVLRTVGKTAAVMTTVGDLGKGFVSAYIGRGVFWLVQQYLVVFDSTWERGLQEFLLIGMYVGMIGAMLGHLFPLYYGFRGGKGILVCGGAILAHDWRIFVTILAIFLIVVLITRYVSLASICASAGFAVFTFVYQFLDGFYPLPFILFNTVVAIAVAATVIGKHHANIHRLLTHTERKLGEKVKEVK